MANRNLGNAATLLPLAIGLAMNAVSTPKPTPSAPTKATSTVHRRHGGTSGGTTAGGGGGGQPFQLPASCTLPFDGTQNSDIDTVCPIDGGGSTTAKRAQSMAKNNLCVAPTSPARQTHQDFVDRQTAVNNDKQINLSNIPDRSVLVAHGEGTFVEYIAFIQDAHYSDVTSGEAVNCNIPGDTTNDIHIVLVQDPNDDPCQSTTAEMIPHFRPTAWTADNVASVKEHPVRIRGPLFYDDAHKPCFAGSPTSRPSPNRISVWEIHPVYSLDVCRMTDLTQCQNSSSSSDWASLEDWIKSGQ